jgi:hypothetical protein
MAAVVTSSSGARQVAKTPAEIDSRIERLSTASLRRVIEPDVDVAGEVGPGPVVPRELLSVADLGLDLTPEQWTTLTREEAASIFDAGIRFESTLMAGFGIQLARMPDLTDPRATYILHELGEETRHSRLFARVIGQLQPTARNPFTRGVWLLLDRMLSTLFLNCRALFCVLVLTGEEAPDLIQKRTAEHPETDPFIRELNRYHRQEEARHLSFARILLPEVWASAGWPERWLVRQVAPLMMAGAVDSLVHPGVYETVGLPGWKTWNQVRKTPSRRQLRAEAFRPILTSLRETGAFGRRGRVPRSWRRECQVDGHGRPLEVSAAG